MRRGLPLAMLLLVACSRADRVVLTANVPADVDWIAALGYRANEALVSGTGLVRRDEASVVEVDSMDGATPLELTADWLPDCPELLAPGEVGYVDIRCPPGCPTEVRQDGCTIVLSAPACGLPAEQGTLTGRGDIHFTGQRVAACQQTAEPGPYRHALECGLLGDEALACRFEVYGPIERGTSLAVQTVTLGEATPRAAFAIAPIEQGLAVLDSELHKITVVAPASGAILDELWLRALCKGSDDELFTLVYEPALGPMVGGRTN